MGREGRDDGQASHTERLNCNKVWIHFWGFFHSFPIRAFLQAQIYGAGAFRKAEIYAALLRTTWGQYVQPFYPEVQAFRDSGPVNSFGPKRSLYG